MEKEIRNTIINADNSGNEDIIRLQKIVDILSSLEKIYYHMDENEYSRMREYIYSRFGIYLQLHNPTNR